MYLIMSELPEEEELQSSSHISQILINNICLIKGHIYPLTPVCKQFYRQGRCNSGQFNSAIVLLLPTMTTVIRVAYKWRYFYNCIIVSVRHVDFSSIGRVRIEIS